MSFPFESGVYSVAPGLRRLEPPVISVRDLSRYRREKLAAATKRSVCLEHELPEDTRAAALKRLLDLLTSEHPETFHEPLPRSLEQLPFLMAEDVAIVQLDGEREWLAFGHVCLPSSWRLEDKIGRPFLEVHRPVPGFPQQGAAAMVRSLASKGPYERFAWGVTNLDVLDQEAGVHAGVEPEPLYVRVERQSMHPLPGCDAWLFLIHPANTPVWQLTAAQRQALAAALESMTAEQAAYKGLATTRAAVIGKLRS
ncbi:MAG: DUF3445 domain-containing protein [Bryobacteraceae bacterium]|nr:DUF3445 domain-containing protein [Bryobacteraceae bacterium]